MSTWTAETILALAPDPSSVKAGKDLAAPRKWATLGAAETALWGECQGSGVNPYQTVVDLTGPAFKCSCPSRKFPCKHGLGLFLLYAATPSEFIVSEPPEWVAKWLRSRSDRQEKKEQTVAEKPAPDPAAQTKRTAQREDKVNGGVAELRTWLNDLVRNGLADAQSKPYKFWDGMASRLIDAQAPGLARLVGRLGGIPASGGGWPERMLESIALINLAIEGWSRIDTLPTESQADIRTAIGFTVNQNDLLSRLGTIDTWEVLGVSVEEEDRLKTKRSWLAGRSSGCAAQILDFAYAGQPLDSLWRTGISFEGELVYFPSAVPLRVLVKTKSASKVTNSIPTGAGEIGTAAAQYRAAIAGNPWMERFPFALGNVVPVRGPNQWFIQDSTGRLALRDNYEGIWQLVALSAGRPIALFGEWNGSALRPLTVWNEDGVWPL